MSLLTNLFQRRTVDICASCGKEDYLSDVGAVSNKFQACRACFDKYGDDRLRAAFNIHIAEGVNLKRKARMAAMASRCFHCGDPTIEDAGGMTPLFCSRCNHELEALRRRVGRPGGPPAPEAE